MLPVPPPSTSPTLIPGHFMNFRMLPQITHHCQQCGQDTSVPYRASVFSEPQYCSHVHIHSTIRSLTLALLCGTVSIGAQVELREPTSATAAMAQQDELAQLFASNMTFSNPTPPPEQPQMRPEHYQPYPPHQPQADVPIIKEPTRVYASTHYTPPTAFGQQATPQASPEPEALSDNQIAEILINHQIDPHALFPSQVNLFRNAGNEQRQRLLELWRISPPNLGAYDIQKEQSTWLETTLAREEEVARLRYERAVMETQGIGSPHQEISRPSSAPAGTSANAEPYMMSGYELLAQREYEKSANGPLGESTRYNERTDPVYAAQYKGIQDMENSYGAFAASREGGMANMGGLDEEMVM